MANWLWSSVMTHFNKTPYFVPVSQLCSWWHDLGWSNLGTTRSARVLTTPLALPWPMRAWRARTCVLQICIILHRSLVWDIHCREPIRTVTHSDWVVWSLLEPVINLQVPYHTVPSIYIILYEIYYVVDLNESECIACLHVSSAKAANLEITLGAPRATHCYKSSKNLLWPSAGTKILTDFFFFRNIKDRIHRIGQEEFNGFAEQWWNHKTK